MDPMHGLKKYDWQIQLDEVIKTVPDNRKIYYLWEPNGCAGKSTYAKSLCMNNGALLCSGKGSDVKFAICEYLTGPDDLEIVIWDIPRSTRKVDYAAVEEIKNGLFFNTKYESKMCIFNPPHIIIFSNIEPDVTELSADRWIIIKI